VQAYIYAPWASSKRVAYDNTCYHEPNINARRCSPYSALLQIWTFEGKGMRLTNASLSKAECLHLAQVLTNLADEIK
jgi:hypothetical protein